MTTGVDLADDRDNKLWGKWHKDNNWECVFIDSVKGKGIPKVKETLKLMSDRPDIKMILFTSSFPEEIEVYQKQFEGDGIIFEYINENPEIASSKGSFGYYDSKHYFNALFEDKAGFNPDRDWKFLYDYFSTTEYRPDPTWSMKYVEEYHKK